MNIYKVQAMNKCRFGGRYEFNSVSLREKMFEPLDIGSVLEKVKIRHHTEEDVVIAQARKILQNDLFADKKILDNLKGYQNSFEVLNEEDIDAPGVFSPANIKETAVSLRLKFLGATEFKPDMPYECILKIKELNAKHGKDLKNFYVLAPEGCFRSSKYTGSGALFARTNHGNYYLLHRWGTSLHWNRKLKNWPMRSFENLVATVLFITLIVTLSLPTSLITLDSKAQYWSGYRAAAFFHLLIFFSGFTTYLVFAFVGNFSNVVWNRKKDFG
jgi:hypothetical protein